MKNNKNVYDNLYNSDLKHMEKNLSLFIKEKKQMSMANKNNQTEKK